MRDLRDPQKLGELLLNLRRLEPKELTLGQVYDANRAMVSASGRYASNESCIEKYGRADEVEPAYAEIRVR